MPHCLAQLPAHFNVSQRAGKSPLSQMETNFIVQISVVLFSKGFPGWEQNPGIDDV